MWMKPAFAEIAAHVVQIATEYYGCQMGEGMLLKSPQESLHLLLTLA